MSIPLFEQTTFRCLHGDKSALIENIKRFINVDKNFVVLDLLFKDYKIRVFEIFLIKFILIFAILFTLFYAVFNEGIVSVRASERIVEITSGSF